MTNTTIDAVPDYRSVFFTTFLLAIATGLALGVVASYVFGAHDLFWVMFLTIGAAVIAVKIRTNRHFKRYGYRWYAKTFPEHVRTEGRISCRHCSGRHISARNLMNQTFHRAHFCNSCGETLYYSPER